MAPTGTCKSTRRRACWPRGARRCKSKPRQTTRVCGRSHPGTPCRAGLSPTGGGRQHLLFSLCPAAGGRGGRSVRSDGGQEDQGRTGGSALQRRDGLRQALLEAVGSGLALSTAGLGPMAERGRPKPLHSKLRGLAPHLSEWANTPRQSGSDALCSVGPRLVRSGAEPNGRAGPAR